MTSFLVSPICSAIDKKSGRTLTAYHSYWDADGRLLVAFDESPRIFFYMGSHDLEPQHIINQELAVHYGFTQGPINATDQQ